MDAVIAPEQWTGVRTALREHSERLLALLADADGRAMATRHWSVADMMAHVTVVAWLDTTLLWPEDDPFPAPGFLDPFPATTVDGVHDLNTVALRHFTERDLKRLTDLFSERVGRLLDGTADRAPEETIEWLGGSRVPIAGLLAHLLNEILLHGYDLARATGRQWTIPPQDAAYFIELFFMGLAREGVGRLLDGGGTPRERPIAVEFRSAHTTPVTIVLRNGQITAEPPGRRPDVRLTFNPATMVLMMFGYVGKARAVLTRDVIIGGRRPWLLPVFLRTLRVPS